VIDRNGTVVSRIKGEALSRNPWTTFGGSESTVAEAIAQMFEDITDHDLRLLTAPVAVLREGEIPPPPPVAVGRPR